MAVIPASGSTTLTPIVVATTPPMPVADDAWVARPSPITATGWSRPPVDPPPGAGGFSDTTVTASPDEHPTHTTSTPIRVVQIFGIVSRYRVRADLYRHPVRGRVDTVDLLPCAAMLRRSTEHLGASDPEPDRP